MVKSGRCSYTGVVTAAEHAKENTILSRCDSCVTSVSRSGQAGKENTAAATAIYGNKIFGS
jgi:hypothetical protein